MSKLNTGDYNLLPYEKVLRYGTSCLTDAELLAVIIRSGTRSCNCVEIARTLLDSAGQMGLLGLKHMNINDYCQIEGIGTVKAVMLMCIGELSSRIAKASMGHKIKFAYASDIAAYCMEEMRHLEQEKFTLLLLNNKCELIHEVTLSMGTVNYTCVSTRDIFIHALRHNAVHFILVHNHPSGDPKPSTEDIDTTMTVKKAGELIGISLIDHVIIGDNRYVSFKEERLL